MAKTEQRTSDEQDQAPDKNFRSSYYKSLGFKDSEKNITHLEALLKADIFGELFIGVATCYLRDLHFCVDTPWY